MYQHRAPLNGGPRPESHFESAQEANDIYDLYGRDSIYGSAQWDDSSSGVQSGLPTSSQFSWGGGASRSSNSNHTPARRYPSPLRYGGKLADDTQEEEHLDDDVSSNYGDEEDIGLPYASNNNNQAVDFSRPSSRGPDFERPQSEYESHYSRQSVPSVDRRWHDDDGNSYIEDADGVTESDHHSACQDSTIGGVAGVPSVAQPVSPTFAPTMTTASAAHAQKARAVGLSPIALSGPTFSAPRACTEPTTPVIETTSADSDPPTPVSAVTPNCIPPHIRDRAVTPEHSASNSLSPLHSNNTSPVHPSISRIYSGARSMSGSSDSSRNGAALGANSNASLVSSQYPGEDPDAYHVRSTYARLEVEGVFGDGWDEGVERTRGGASNTTSRMTMVFPSKDSVMTDSEREYISSLDRYGFVNTPTRSRSEGRLALVPAAPFGKVPKLQVRSSLGVPRQPTPQPQMTPSNLPPPPSPLVPGEARSVPTQKARKKEEERVAKWMRMMSVGQRDSGRNILSWKWSSNGEGAKHPTRIYKGIPDRWRMAAWWTLAEERAVQANCGPSHQSLESDYLARRDGPSENDVQIDLDVPRTISGHALFRTRFGHGQRALFHVLHAFSQACETCGYCQGMGSIAATLLCYFEPERAYTLLIRMHDLYDMHGIFAPGFPGLLETFYVHERLIECLMPDVYESFQRNMISSSAWGAKIYITLFVNVVPFNVQLRLWDAMFLDGYSVMVMAVIALVWAYRPLLAAPGATFESILSLLSSFYVPEDEDAMLQWMRKMLWTPGTKERIAFWRREWRGLVERGQTDGVLL